MRSFVTLEQKQNAKTKTTLMQHISMTKLKRTIETPASHPHYACMDPVQGADHTDKEELCSGCG